MLVFEPLLLSLTNLPILPTTPVSVKNLLLTFNGQLFYTLADVLTYISNYPKGKKRVFLYIDIIEQVAMIFNLESAFADGLIKVLKKDKSFAIV